MVIYENPKTRKAIAYMTEKTLKTFLVLANLIGLSGTSTSSSVFGSKTVSSLIWLVCKVQFSLPIIVTIYANVNTCCYLVLMREVDYIIGNFICLNIGYNTKYGTK
jgi:hypothetical protein